MSTISRRSFLKLAGATAVAAAGASMLTGCSWFDDVDLIVMGSTNDGKTYREVLRKTLSRITVSSVRSNLDSLLKLVQEEGPEAYRNAEITVDRDYPGCLTFTKDEKTGKECMIIALRVAVVEIEYTVLVNGKSVANGETDQFPKGVTKIPSDKALELVKGKLNYPPYNTVDFEIDKDYPDNLTVKDGKVTIAVLGFKG